MNYETLRQARHVNLSTEKNFKKNIQVHIVANIALSQQHFACDPDEKRLHKTIDFLMKQKKLLHFLLLFALRISHKGQH